ncbi:nuclear transport factor 2 family protein [Paraburkholderia pallida]|uniref:Nuclear transport factor 2 family protein n=1 Tax=Paraburkholderia pallida TaxID=2547399 RepID=A0A4P7CX25_9BURK|nr:nuclear transport factor 2 family protein [Paraburkholderia pallida]QBQ98724.1 nuclear transport factor 2 family protein [Paraburkholderia pallida]
MRPFEEDDVESMRARRACEEAVLAFVRAFDDGRPDAMLLHFAPDGVWERADGTVAGHDGIVQMMQRRSQAMRVRHVITNMIATLHGADEASVKSYVTVYRHDEAVPDGKPAPLRGPALVGEYTDELRRIDGRWRIGRKQVQAWFKAMEENK